MVAAAAIACLAPPALAQADPFGADREHVKARLTGERTALVAGETGYVGVVFTIDRGWHTYWPGLNDTGFPVTVKLAAPEGFEVGETVYPAPHRHVSPGEILDHVYEGTLLLMVPIEVPEDAAGSTVTISGRADWLVCDEACVPGSEDGLRLALPVVSPGETTEAGADAALFGRTRLDVPRPIEESEPSVRVRWVMGTALIETNDATRLEFYPGAESAPLGDPIGGATADDSRLILRPAEGEDGPIEGVVRVEREGQDRPAFYRFRVDPHEPIATP